MRRPLLLFGLLILALLLSACTNAPEPTAPVGTPTPTAAPTPAETAAATETPAPTPKITAAPLPSATPAPEAPSPTPDWTQGDEGELVVRLDGEERHVPAVQREYVLHDEPYLSFCLLVPEEVSQPRYENNAWYISLDPQGEGKEGAAWLELSRISGGSAEDLLPDFMSAYLKFTEIEFSGASLLGRERMDETITASGEGLLVKAWLLDVPQGVFSAVLCCSAERLDPDLSYLEAMLDTFSLKVEK